MGDSVDNTSPADDTVTATASAVNDAVDADRTTVEQSEVNQLTRCFIKVFERW